MIKEKLLTPPRTHTSRSSIFSPKSPLCEKMNVENPSEQIDIDLQETTKFHNIQVSSCAATKCKMPSETGKSFKAQADPFSVFLDVNSATGFKKNNFLKASIKAATQSCLCITVEKQIDMNYQSTCKEKLIDIAQSLALVDETTVIVKCSEHAVKVKDSFVVLEEDARAKAK